MSLLTQMLEKVNADIKYINKADPHQEYYLTETENLGSDSSGNDSPNDEINKLRLMKRKVAWEKEKMKKE